MLWFIFKRCNFQNIILVSKYQNLVKFNRFYNETVRSGMTWKVKEAALNLSKTFKGGMLSSNASAYNESYLFTSNEQLTVCHELISFSICKNYIHPSCTYSISSEKSTKRLVIAVTGLNPIPTNYRLCILSMDVRI